jgi:hypothetical protein
MFFLLTCPRQLPPFASVNVTVDTVPPLVIFSVLPQEFTNSIKYTVCGNVTDQTATWADLHLEVNGASVPVDPGTGCASDIKTREVRRRPSVESPAAVNVVPPWVLTCTSMGWLVVVCDHRTVKCNSSCLPRTLLETLRPTTCGTSP